MSLPMVKEILDTVVFCNVLWALVVMVRHFTSDDR